MTRQQARTPAVLYAAKSTEDKRGSIPTQLEQAREMAERECFQAVDEFSDEAFSAYSGNRGPGLERAKARAAELAADHGRCILVAQDADRFARGAGDAPGAADHLGEVYFAMNRQGVELWTVRSGHLDLLRAAIEGERSHDESARKTQSVKAGKRRQAERGEHLGGPIPDGYRRESSIDDHGQHRKRVVIDPDRVDVVRGIFKLAAEGVPDAELARRLNVDGVTTRKGNAWTRRAVQDLITRPFYAGRIVYEGETFEGAHKPLIAPGEYDRLIAARPERDLGRGKHTVGRPAKLHALQGLAICGPCGRRLNSYTASYKRKDGGRQRLYRCPSYSESNCSCTVTTFDALAVDAAVLGALDDLLPDFDTWLEQVTERHFSERDRLEALRDRCRSDRDKQTRRVDAVEAKWSEYVATDDAKADLVLPMVERERKTLADLETRAQATQDALESVPVEAPADALLDFALSLQRALGGIDTNGSMEQVNVALAGVFKGFVLWQEDGVTRIEPLLHLSVGRALLEQHLSAKSDTGRFGPTWPLEPDPLIHPEAGSWMVRPDEEPPPMRWLSAAAETDGISDHSHEYLRTKPKRPAFAASQPYAEDGPRSSSVAQRCSEWPGGATQRGSGWRAKSAACSASERYPETTTRSSSARRAAAAIRSKVAATSGRIPSQSRHLSDLFSEPIPVGTKLGNRSCLQSADARSPISVALRAARSRT